MADRTVEDLLVDNARLREALEFYADPETYHAIVFLADAPCGEFIDDLSDNHHHPNYNRSMPGSLARTVLGLSYEDEYPHQCDEQCLPDARNSTERLVEAKYEAWAERQSGPDWMTAPLPRRIHRCRAVTSAFVSGGLVERCACGAIRCQPPGMRMAWFWSERNSRRPSLWREFLCLIGLHDPVHPCKHCGRP